MARRLCMASAVGWMALQLVGYRFRKSRAAASTWSEIRKIDWVMEIKPVASLRELSALKAEYLARTTAPLDGMWLCALVPMASHFGFYQDSALLGYCCLNDEAHLLQFHMQDTSSSKGSALLGDLLAGKFSAFPQVEGACVSTAEPAFLSLCFDHFSAFRVNSVMYQLDVEGTKPKPDIGDDNDGMTLGSLLVGDLAEAVAFVLRNLPFPEEWLTGYFSNLIDRRELFGCRLDGVLIGTGEHRLFDDVQTDYSELGVIVDNGHQRKGVGTWILQRLVGRAIELGRKPICSTEGDNVGAQKAIERAGFIARNRIIHFST